MSIASPGLSQLRTRPFLDTVISYSSTLALQLVNVVYASS